MWPPFRWFFDREQQEEEHHDGGRQVDPILINLNRSYDSSFCSQGTAALSFEEEEEDVDAEQQHEQHRRLLSSSSSSSSTFASAQKNEPRHHHHSQKYQSIMTCADQAVTREGGGGGSSTRTKMTILQRMRNQRNAKSAWKKLAQAVDHLLVLDDDDDSGGNHDDKTVSPSPSRTPPRPSHQKSHGHGHFGRRDRQNGIGGGGGGGGSLEERVTFFLRSSSSSSEPQCSMTFLCLFAVSVYLLVAVVAFSYLLPDHFTIIDSCYFAVVTFTTIGYGDVTPTDPASRCFTALFALTGITVLGLVLGHMGSAILDAQEAAVEQAKKDHAATLERIFMTTDNSNNSSSSREVVDTNNLKQQTKDLAESATTSNGDGGATLSSSLPWSGWHLVWEFARCLLVLAIFAAILAANDPGVRDHGWRGALYYAIITATTVGYGDLAPTTQRGRLWAVLLIPIAVAVMGHWISAVATYIMERRQMDNLRRKLLERDLQIADLTIMDENGDGQVSPLEFLRFMLVAMNKVDVRTLEQIQSYFEQLDVDGTGTLNKHDIIANAKKKLRQTNRKLELSAYKQRLIALGRRGGGGSGGGRQQQRPSHKERRGPAAAAAGQLRQSLSLRWGR